MVHGTHREDFEIERIVVSSAQAQGEAMGENGIFGYKAMGEDEFRSMKPWNRTKFWSMKILKSSLKCREIWIMEQCRK